VLRSREGDFIADFSEVIFDVKGLVHPPDKVVAFPRFVPDRLGNRRLAGKSYRKVYALSERFTFLQTHFPHYLIFDPVFGERLCEIPKKDINHHYDPVSRLGELRGSDELEELEGFALHFLEALHGQAIVPWSKLGISGSLLAKLHTTESDIDPIVYGKSNCVKVYEMLKLLTNESRSAIKAYSLGELRDLYSFRSRDTQTSFDDFVETERRKVLQGKFLQHDYFIRCVRDWKEIEEYYGEAVYHKIGYARIKAIVSDCSEAIFTPCRYVVENVRLLEGKSGEDVAEVVSFRGRFCEQARTGETVVAQGKVEEVKKKNGEVFVRLLLGGQVSDFMVLEG